MCHVSTTETHRHRHTQTYIDKDTDTQTQTIKQGAEENMDVVVCCCPEQTVDLPVPQVVVNAEVVGDFLVKRISRVEELVLAHCSWAVYSSGA